MAAVYEAPVSARVEEAMEMETETEVEVGVMWEEAMVARAEAQVAVVARERMVEACVAARPAEPGERMEATTEARVGSGEAAKAMVVAVMMAAMAIMEEAVNRAVEKVPPAIVEVEPAVEGKAAEATAVEEMEVVDEKDLEVAETVCAQKENRQQQRVSRELPKRCFKTCLIWELCVNRNIVIVADG